MTDHHEPFTREDGLRFLTTDPDTGEDTGHLRVPCSRYGSTSEDCAPVAWRVAEIVAGETDGHPPGPEELDAMMSLVVNDSDEPARFLAEYGTPDERDEWITHRDDWGEIRAAALAAYIECALWSSVIYAHADDDGTPADEYPAADSLADDLADDLGAFLADHYGSASRAGWTPEQFGHDFWLTRNGHGAGFWDRGYRLPLPGSDGTGDPDGSVGRMLTDAAHVYGTVDLYLDDDGTVNV